MTRITPLMETPRAADPAALAAARALTPTQANGLVDALRHGFSRPLSGDGLWRGRGRRMLLNVTAGHLIRLRLALVTRDAFCQRLTITELGREAADLILSGDAVS